MGRILIWQKIMIGKNNKIKILKYFIILKNFTKNWKENLKKISVLFAKSLCALCLKINFAQKYLKFVFAQKNMKYYNTKNWIGTLFKISKSETIKKLIYPVSYTHLDVYKRQKLMIAVCLKIADLPAIFGPVTICLLYTSRCV